MREEEDLAHWIDSLPPAWTAGCDASVFAQARDAYGTPGRHYHTWQHATACIDQLRTFPCENPRLVFLALVFHDAVYVPGRPDNEEKSAALAREVLTPVSLDESQIESIVRMIIATRDHHAHAASLSDDDKPMLDLDLSILGAPREIYARYARAIHDEYCPAVAPEAQYRIGRRAFLEGLASKPHIFITGEGQRRWDESARANLLWESGELASQQGVAGRAISAIKNSLG